MSTVEATDKRTTKTRDTREPNESARTDNTKPTIELQRCGQHVLISPPFPQLQWEFCTVWHETVYNVEHGYQVRPVRHPLLQLADVPYGDGEKCLHTFAGLEPLVQQWLTEHGYAVKMAGIRPKRLIRPDTERLQRVGDIDHSMLECVRTRDRALIRYEAGKVDRSKLIAQIALAWPKARIVIWVTRKRDGQRLARKLGKHIPDVALFCSADRADKWGRVMIVTYGYSIDNCVERDQRDIAIALDPDELLRNQYGRYAVEDASKSRLFGFMRADKELAPYDRDRVTALFGMRELYIPKHGRTVRPVYVAFKPIFGGTRLDSGLQDTWELKRQGICKHHVRNRKIAQLARAVASGNREVLYRELPALCERLCGLQRPRTGIIVDNVEHGLRLAEELEWPFVTSQDTWEGGLSRGNRDILRRGRIQRSTESRNLIISSTELHRFRNIAVLIRADGGTGLGALPEKPIDYSRKGAKAITARRTKCPESPGGSKQEQGHKPQTTTCGDYSLKGLIDPSLLIIDFRDRHHPVLRRQYQERKQAYVEAGWNIMGEDENSSPLQRFMATRPEGVVV